MDAIKEKNVFLVLCMGNSIMEGKSKDILYFFG